jgi:DNA-binding HxlR family transcriptional regulator
MSFGPDLSPFQVPHAKCVAMIALDGHGRAIVTRDMELVRQILLAIKARQTTELTTIELPDVQQNVLNRHLELLSEAHLIDAKVHPSGKLVLVKDMTWAGHDFLSALDNDNVWSKMKKTFTPSELAGMAFATLKSVGSDLLTEWTKAKIGMS